MLRQKMNQAFELIKKHKVRKITPQMWQVEDNKVSLIIKQGRALMLCTCKNHTDYCLENPLCLHKLSVILLESPNKFDLDVHFLENQLKELIDENSKLRLQIREFKKVITCSNIPKKCSNNVITEVK